MLTGKALTPAEAKRYQICIEDYIMKPFLKDELFASIEHVLTRKKKIKDTIALAKRAGVDKNTFCEFARLSKRVDVNNKLIELLQKTYPNALREDVNAGDINQGIEEMIANARLNETHLEQLKLKINSAFMAKGYPLPSL
jgi:DNA-binding response OmpR family regulator